jgi:hypothetical protein
MCLDKTSMVWLEAFMAGTKPRITAPGIGYMAVVPPIMMIPLFKLRLQGRTGRSILLT